MSGFPKAGGSGTISTITSSDFTLTNPTGPTTNVDGPLTANLAAGGFKITGLANGSAATDAAAFGQITAGGAVASGKLVAVATTGSTIVTYAPTVAGNFLIGIYFTVVTATTNVTVTVTWTDATGAQTLTLLNAVAELVGSYTMVSFEINSVITSPITVAMTAGTASQVYASASILQG
jgi:hypothetical protein